MPDVAELILRRRRQCLVHRFLYYVRAETLVSDYQYDMWERELKALVLAHPDVAAHVQYADDCPTTKPGSSNLDDYPRELQMLADSLLVYNMENLDWWARVTAPQEESDVGAIESKPEGFLF